MQTQTTSTLEIAGWWRTPLSARVLETVSPANVSPANVSPAAASGVGDNGGSGPDYRDFLAAGRGQETVARNFGLIDAAGQNLDGRASAKDLYAAADSGLLLEQDASVLRHVVLRPAEFARLDAMDGFADGMISFAALQAPPGQASKPVGLLGREVPDVLDARYNQAALNELTSLAIGAGGGHTLASTPLGAKVADYLDGTPDGVVTFERVPGQFNLRSRVLDAPANDASNRSILTAALGALTQIYSQIDTSRPDLSAADRTRAQFASTLAARQLLSAGIPMDRGADGFNADLDGQFLASQVLDSNQLSSRLPALLADPTIQADLSAQLRQFTPNLPTRVRELEAVLSSSLYADTLLTQERSGQGLQARQRVSDDLAALRLLDPAAAERASARLLDNMAQSVIEEGNFTNTPTHNASLAIGDVLQTMAALKAMRVVLRSTGQLATTISKFADIQQELAAAGVGLEKLSTRLAQLFRQTQSTGGDILDARRLVADIDSGSLNALASPLERSAVKRFIITLDRYGVWQTGAAMFGVAGGVYRLAHPGENPWDRLYAAQEFLAAASHITGPAKALGQMLDLRGGAAPSKFNSAIGASLVDLVKANQPVWNRAAIPSTDLSVFGDPRGMPSTKHRVVAAAIKGFASVTEVGSAVMGIAIGAKNIAVGLDNDDAGGIALGALNVGAGVATMTGAALSAAFAVGTPILIAGGVLSLVGLVAGALMQKSGDQVLADQLEKRLGQSGLLREGWRDALRQWWVDNGKFNASGMGLEM